jgi:hypothetical protein
MNVRRHPECDGDHDTENTGSGEHGLSPLFFMA